MSLWSCIGRLRTVEAPGAEPVRAGSRVILKTSVPPVIRYVAALLSEVCEKGYPLTLDERHSPPRGWSGPALPFRQVESRLKVLAGLNPVPLPGAVSRTFDHVWQGQAHRIEVCFDDRGEAPTCRVALARPARAPAAARAE